MQSTRAYGEDDPYVNIPITAGMIGFDGVMDLAVPIGCADIVVGGEYGFSIARFSVSDNDPHRRVGKVDCPFVKPRSPTSVDAMVIPSCMGLRLP